jgi:AraC-like DNA-binding protein
LPAIPLIRASQLAPFAAAMKGLGVPEERLLNRARLPQSWRERRDDFVVEERLWSLLDEVRRVAGVHDFGLRAGRGGQVTDIGPFGLRLVESVTLLDALGAMTAEVGGHSSHARFRLVRRGGIAWFCRDGIQEITVGRDEAEQYTLTLMMQLVQLAAGASWRPDWVRLQAVEASWATSSSELCDARIEPGAPATALALPVFLLACPLMRGGTAGSQVAGPAADIVGSLRQALRPLLAREAVHVGLAAEIAQTSVRTLERRLQDSGLGWRRLLDQIRCDAAVEWLSDPGTEISDIAYELGYADPASFTRAFRRWTGVTPSSYRTQMGSAELLLCS